MVARDVELGPNLRKPQVHGAEGRSSSSYPSTTRGPVPHAREGREPENDLRLLSLPILGAECLVSRHFLE